MARDGRSNAEPPIGVLIETQYLPAERHPERHEQKENPDDPGELTRKLISPEEEDLDHVNENDRDHEIRAPSVQRTDEPAESHVVVHSLETTPRFSGGWDAIHRMENHTVEMKD